MHGTIKGHKVRILIDDGASHNFLNYKLIKRLKILETPSSHSYKVEMIWDKALSKVWGTYVFKCPLEIQ